MPPASPPLPTPEELRRDYSIHQEEQDRLRERRRKAFRRRWILISALIGLFPIVPNYMDLRWITLLHAPLCAVLGYLIVLFRRGHLTGMVVIGCTNMVLSVLLGCFNPIGVLAFTLAGAFIGMGVMLERDL